LRIGYFTNTYPRATDTFIQREIKGLRERGFDVRTFSVRRSGDDHDVSPEIIAEKQNTFYVLSVNLFVVAWQNVVSLITKPGCYLSTLALACKTSQPGLKGWLKQLIYFCEAVVLVHELKRQEIDHLHNHLGDNSGTVTLLVSRLSGIGYSISFHGPHIFFDPTHWALREKVKYSRFVSCISHYCKSQMMLFSDQEDWQRLNIIHCGVDVDQFHYIERGACQGKMLYTGRLAVEKGVPVLFESLSILKEEGYTFELTLVGDGPDRKILEIMARQSGLIENVIFAGFQSPEKVRDFLEQSDLFILPSFAEGVPVSLMEAMACGVPVVASYVGGVVELVEPDKTGLMAYSGDPVSLKNAISSYLDSAELRERVSKAGREKIVAEFNLDCEVDKLAELFKRAVKKGGE